MKTITTVTVLDENSSRWLFIFYTTHRIAACSTVGMRDLWRHVAFFAYEQAIGVVTGAARNSRPIPIFIIARNERCRMLKSVLNSTRIIVIHLALRLVSQPDMP